MNAAPASAAAQPYLGTDVAAFVFALTALLCLVLWRRDREPGMGWFALAWSGFAIVLRLVSGSDFAAVYPSPYIPPSAWYYVVVMGLACMAFGMLDYLGVPSVLRRRALWITLLPLAVYALLVTLAVAGALPVRRLWMNGVGAAFFLSLGGLSWWASRREPLAGHRYVALALWAVPVASLAMALGRVHPVALRYFSLLPILVLALTLLTVSVLRRRRALEAEVLLRSAAEAELTRLNASLEQLVEQRTRDLRSMVEGLASFNRSVSHDLRGPLGGIAGIARLANEALQRNDDAVARRVLPVIADQAENATRLVAALLSLAQVGDRALQLQVVDLRRLVAGVVDQLALEWGDRKLPQITLGALPQVRADPELLERVLCNLIGNAIKFTSEAASGGIEIGAQAGSGDVEVFVRDNGVGFDADQAARLFVPFVRLHGAAFAGHGIGLSIVRRAIERHGGRVWAESRPGQGAEFRFSLPA